MKSIGKALDAIKTLLHREYWDRHWVVQEIVMASSITIWCGKARIR